MFLEVTMKQLFLSLLLCTSFVGIQAGYTPAAGPLTFGDSGPAHHLTRGAIMKAVIDNKPANPNSNPKLAAANLDLADFDGRGQAFRTYQEIMHNISQSTNAEAALQAAKAIETVIMHLYDYDTYALGSYKPCRSIFMTDIRYHSIFSDDEKLKQLIDELEKLANIVSVHSKSMSLRLKATVHSYRHWRRNMALTCAAYLAGDAIKHGAKNSIVNQFYQGGFRNSPEIALNHFMNVGYGVLGIGKGLGKGVQLTWTYGAKPAGKFLFGGAAAFKSQPGQAASTQNSAMSAIKIAEQPKVEIISTTQSKNSLEKAMQIDHENFQVQVSPIEVSSPVVKNAEPSIVSPEPVVAKNTEREKAKEQLQAVVDVAKKVSEVR